ncbi:MAG: 50S ribosomal protein L21 [Spirochaetales bacterium]|nr:50S ribosomal protein L21 [Spirochaetales bacterium]
MYALVDIKGKQYRAEKGSVLKIDRVKQEKGEKIAFDSVLLISDGGKVNVGTPYVDGARVQAVVEEHGRDKKIVVFKYKKRKHYRKKNGHRQHYSVIKIQDISKS